MKARTPAEARAQAARATGKYEYIKRGYQYWMQLPDGEQRRFSPNEVMAELNALLARVA